MGAFSFWHILILLVIIFLLLGGNRFSTMMGDIAKGLKSFKTAMADDDETSHRAAAPPRLPPQQARVPDTPESVAPGSGDKL